MVLVAGVATNLIALRSAAGREFKMPPEITLPATMDDWKGTDVPVPDNYHSILPHSRICTAEYTMRTSPAVALTVIASRDPNDMHTPDRCIKGSGFEIVTDELKSVSTEGPDAKKWTMHEMHITKSDADELVYYGYDGLGTLGGSTLLARIAMKIGGASTKPAYFIRFSTPVNGDVAAARARLVPFIKHMMSIRSTWEIPAKATENA
jgi:EpsI family protein